MANIKSAEKRVKIAEVRSKRNQMKKSELKTVIKKFDAVSGADKSASEGAFRAAVKKIDTAVSEGILHKNTAARRKSTLAKKLNAIKAQA